MRDWTHVYSRELIESPPADDLVASHLGYQPPADLGRTMASDTAEPEVWECPYPDETE